LWPGHVLLMAAPTHELRARAERLLRGDFRVDDLTKLFLFARDRCDGRQSVQEIGDFVAHHDERSKGIVTRTVRDLLTILRIQLPRFNQQPRFRKPYNLSELPPNFPLFLDAAMRRMTSRIMRERTGIALSKATKMLPSIKSRLIQNA